MEGTKLVGHSWHETVVVVDHAKEALKAGLPEVGKGKSFTL